ncbi:MAG: homocysteine S-methyltransferase family protein, partial [Gammaproteobacteria bacterium]|nr:homocysteine S-methyltransferase family protein [Gammaproteobacteria bacterium]
GHYVTIAKQYNTGLILEAPTWRASTDWGLKLGYNAEALDRINHKAIQFLDDFRAQANLNTPCINSGCIGPRYDGYNPECYMSAEQAEYYHSSQIKSFSEAGADIVTALTMTNIKEACGIIKSAMKNDVEVVISFTTETDGRLPSGETLQQAIEQLDQISNTYPLYYMINCAHPTHFETVLQQNQPWLNRIGGIRANASCKSHAELDECTELDAGNPQQLGQEYKQLKTHLTNLNVVGGCCGTSHQHVSAMTQACFG